MNFFRKIIDVGAVLLSFVLLIASWAAIILALAAFASAVDAYGLSFSKVFLDARLGYLGLLALGLSSCALIVASFSNIKERIGTAIKLFSIAFFVGLLLMFPTIFAIMFFLINQL